MVLLGFLSLWSRSVVIKHLSWSEPVLGLSWPPSRTAFCLADPIPWNSGLRRLDGTCATVGLLADSLATRSVRCLTCKPRRQQLHTWTGFSATTLAPSSLAFCRSVMSGIQMPGLRVEGLLQSRLFWKIQTTAAQALRHHFCLSSRNYIGINFACRQC